jgi:hypothetical protein
MNSLWDIRIFLGLVPKESPYTMKHGQQNIKFDKSILSVYMNTW